MPFLEFVVEPPLAVAAASEKLEAARKKKDKLQEAEALRVLAKAQLSNGSHIDALQTVTSALTIFRSSNNKKGEAACLYVVALVQQARELIEESLYAAREAQKLFKELKDTTYEAAVWYIIAEVRHLAQEFGEAAQAAQSALALARGPAPNREKALLLTVLARAQLGLKEIDGAVASIKEVFNLCETLTDGAVEDLAFGALIPVFAAKKSLDEAMDIVQGVRGRHKQAGNKIREAAALSTMAVVHDLQEEFASAVVVAKQAVALAQEAQDNASESKARVVVARVCLANGDAQDAQGHALEAAALFRVIKDKSGELSALEVLINSYVKKNEFDEAVHVASQALDRFKEAGDLKLQAAMMLAIAEANMKLQDVEGALVFMKKARATFNECKDSRGEASAFQKIAQLCTTIGDVEEALWSTQRATALYRKMRDRSGEAGILLIVADMSFARAWGFLVQDSPTKSEQQVKEALRNAEMALQLFKLANDQRGQILALLSKANAHLMLKEAPTALQTASTCVDICKEIGDTHLEAGALLVQGGANLAEGRVDAAQEAGSESVRLFRQHGDAMGSEASGNFMKDARDAESGDFNTTGFRGFYLRGTDSFQPMPSDLAAKVSSKKEKKAERKGPQAFQSNLLILDPNGDPTTFFDGFESRQAGVSQQQKKLQKAAEDADQQDEVARADAGPRYRAEAPPVYAIRWQGITAKPGTAKAEGGRASRLSAKAEGPLRGLIDAGPVGAGTYFPPVFKLAAAR